MDLHNLSSSSWKEKKNLTEKVKNYIKIGWCRNLCSLFVNSRVRRTMKLSGHIIVTGHEKLKKKPDSAWTHQHWQRKPVEARQRDPSKFPINVLYQLQTMLNGFLFFFKFWQRKRIRRRLTRKRPLPWSNWLSWPTSMRVPNRVGYNFSR